MKRNNEIEKRMQKQTRQKQEKILDSLVGTIESVEETIGEEPEAEEDAAVFDPALPTVKKRKTLFAVGLFVIVMTVVGIVSTVKSVVGLVEDIANQTALKSEFASFLYPLVLTDVPAFDSPENAPNSVVITGAIWNIILYGDKDKYERNGSQMIVSEIDVESSAAALFGYGIPVTHETVRLGDLVFAYDSSSRSYTVAENPRIVSYYPRIKSISAVGELYTITVDYVAPSVYSANGLYDEAQAEKTMVYKVSRTGTATTVQSVEYQSTEELLKS